MYTFTEMIRTSGKIMGLWRIKSNIIKLRLSCSASCNCGYFWHACVVLEQDGYSLWLCYFTH